MTELVSNIKELINFRGLLIVWTLREIKVRYKQSLLGAAWAILQPLSIMLIFTVVFSYFTRIPTGDTPYPVFSYAALLPWTLLATSVSMGVPSLVNNLNLVVKTYFPKEILPLGSIFASCFDFIIASSVFLILLLYYRVPFTATLLWVPLIFFIQLLLIIGITLLGAAIIVVFRDVRFIVPLFLQIWLYATPVIYPVEVIPDKFIGIYFLNPMAGIISAYRQVILNGEPPDLNYLAISGSITLVLFVLGYYVFKRLEPSFADII